VRGMRRKRPAAISHAAILLMDPGVLGPRGATAVPRVAWARSPGPTVAHTLLIVMEENVRVQYKRRRYAT